ncbi:MAG TPA: hypothetical protein ENJ23_00895 [Bacteroidetes bacterium]|nr:hypothetical protein [Bacteroidota bacterium]
MAVPADTNHRLTGEIVAPVERLTALWALSEAGLGGVLHALRWPFTGILVGGFAVILISLIASFAERPGWAILRATIIVLIIKAMVSPHTPIQAYFAVGFQGLAGAGLFTLLPHGGAAEFLLAILAMAEAAFQKLLVLTILYGRTLWHALDLFFDYVSRQVAGLHLTAVVSGSELTIASYVGLHLVGGVVIGWAAIRIPRQIGRTLNEAAALPQEVLRLQLPSGSVPKRKRRKRRRVVSFLVLLLLILAALILRNPNARGMSQAAYVVVRAMVVLAVWYLILAPLVIRLFVRFIDRKKTRYSGELTAALSVLPSLRRAAVLLWSESRKIGGLAGARHFVRSLILFALLFEPEPPSEETLPGTDAS